VGSIESYDQFGPQSWNQSGRYTSINGQIMPLVTNVQAGRIERWRFVHAGVRNTIKLQFQPMRANAPSFARLAAADQSRWISDNCTGDIVPHWEIAADGLTRAQIVERSETTFQPGYRTDALVAFPKPGRYCVLDLAAPAAGSVTAEQESRQFLGAVDVGPGQNVTTDQLKGLIRVTLMIANDRFMPPALHDAIRDALLDDLRIPAFEPHKSISADEVDGKQPPLTFNIDVSMSPPLFEVDGRPYDPGRVDRTLQLGKVEEWSLHATEIAGHPFHIHVNPFQIVTITNPAGVDVSETGEADDKEYADMKGVWKDTIFIKPGYTVTMRTRYQRYIGEFVLHCHILDHEDQGMMENVLIALPDGKGGVAVGHH
jgi:L-ascorbate oxidase